MSQASRPARRHIPAAVAYGLALLGALWLVAASCATPELGVRLYDRGEAAAALPWLEAAAARGSVPSSHRLGLLLMDDTPAPRDLPRALALFSFAAARNHIPSQILAGDLTRSLLDDDAEAAGFYAQAAGRGDATAMARLGIMRASGAGGPADIDAALDLLGRAARAGNAQAATALGQTLLSLGAAGDPRGGAPAEAAVWFEAAGRAGDAEALTRLAELVAEGRGLPADPVQAAGLRRRAAEAGHAPAAYDLGLMYLTGQGVTAYPLEAARVFERAAEAGHVGAMLQLGDMYFAGLGVFRDQGKAVALYDAAATADDRAAAAACQLFAAGPEERRDEKRAGRYCAKAAEAGDAASAMLLGLGMVRGRLAGDAGQGAALLSKAAWAGNGQAMYAMALLHLAGQGVSGNPAEAFRWCAKAAEAGLPEAKALLAALSEEEFPSAANLAKAIDFYREAATAGDAEAGFALGSLLSKGLAGPPDFAEARKWYGQAAAAGDARAQFNLGLMYLTGKGGPVNDAEALRWMREAAGRGDAHARSNVATMTLAGRGTPSDPREAFRWYRLAAGQGYAQAQAMLAGFYYEGRVVPRDFESALYWLSLASRAPGGDPLLVRAGRAKMVLEKRLTPDQLERVAARLAAYKAAGFDPEAEKLVVEAIKFLPPSARGPGYPSTTAQAGPGSAPPPTISAADPKALF